MGWEWDGGGVLWRVSLPIFGVDFGGILEKIKGKIGGCRIFLMGTRTMEWNCGLVYRELNYDT